MKKIFTLFFSAFSFACAFAQITFTSADMPVAPWNEPMAKQSSNLAVSFGSKGANQFYNFSNITLQSHDTIYYQVPSSTPYASSFTNADDGVTIDGTNYFYYKTTTAAFQTLGIAAVLVSGGSAIPAPYTDPADVFRFPSVYGTNFRDTSTLSKTVLGSDVGQSSIYQIRVTATTYSTDTIDGWGKITTPLGSYKCQRKQRKDVTTTLIEYKLFSISPWATLSGYPTTTTTVRYTYPTKETKGTSVVVFEYDNSNNVTSASYALVPPNAPVPNFGYASGGGGLIFFTDSTDGYPDSYSWNFGDGDTSSAQNPNHTYTANGSYYVCLTVTNAGGSNTYCDSVHVTGIAASNNPPVAVTDTVTLLQATSVTIHAAANDIDPDGNQLCVDTVWGSPYVSEGVGGSCDLVKIQPDSSFTGTDTAYYRVCDNGTPVLCDTGLIIFTVDTNPALNPVANFTATNPAIFNCGASVNADSAFMLINTSAHNYDTVYWHIKAEGGACNDSLVEYWVDTVNVTPAQFAAQWGCSNFDTLEICMFVSNQFGWDAKCEIVCGITWQTTGINEISLSNISVYPNPASSVLTIDMRNNNDEAANNYSSLEIFNVLGEAVIRQSNAGKSKLVNIPVSALPQGMYVAALTDSKGVRRTLGRFTKE